MSLSVPTRTALSIACVFPFSIVQGVLYLRADDEKWAKIAPPRAEAQERRTKRQSIIAGSIALLIFVGLPVYLVVREQQAKADAHAFCDAAAAGDPIGPVKARAEGLGRRYGEHRSAFQRIRRRLYLGPILM